MGNLARFPARERESESREPQRGERELLAAIRSGDCAAAEELVDRTYAAVFASLCRLCGDSDLAADLTQETYQKAWAALGGFDGRSQLFTWLYRIAYTTFLNHIRRPRRLSQLDEEQTTNLRDEAPGADEILSEGEENDRLRRAVLRLPDELRFTVSAHFWGGLAVKEVAELESITTVAIRKRLHRAFTMLETMLEEESR